MTDVRYVEAKQLWEWVQWRLTPDLWMQGQQELRDTIPPSPSDPQPVAGLAQLLNPATTNAQRLLLIQQLLGIIKSGPRPPSK